MHLTLYPNLLKEETFVLAYISHTFAQQGATVMAHCGATAATPVQSSVLMQSQSQEWNRCDLGAI